MASVFLGGPEAMSYDNLVRTARVCQKCNEPLPLWSIKKLCAYCKALPLLRQAIHGGGTDD